MLNPPHILIIGAGLIGLSTADSALRRGAKVTIVDKHSAPALGTSFSNSGMLHPSQVEPWDSSASVSELKSLISLAEKSRDLTISRMKELNIPLRKAGCLKMYNNGKDLLAAKNRYAELGIRAEIRHEPMFGRQHHMLFFPNDSSGDAYDYACALARDLESRGASFFFGMRDVVVTELKAIYKADHIVICAGAASPELAKAFGIDISMKAIAGHALNFEKPDIALPDYPIMHAASHSAMTVFKDHLRLSGSVNVATPDILLDIWRDIAPEITQALDAPIMQWTGYRPVIDGNYPLIGPTDIQGVWLNTGHGHMGWTLCSGSGERLARMMLG